MTDNDRIPALGWTLRASPVVDRIAFLAIGALSCCLLLALRDALRNEPTREPTGSLLSSDFTSSLGAHHILTQLGSVIDRDAAIRRHVEEAMAFKAAVKEKVP